MFGAGSAGMTFPAGPLTANPVISNKKAFTSPPASITTGSAKVLPEKAAFWRRDLAPIPSSDASSSNDKSSVGNSFSADAALTARPKNNMITQTSLLEIPRTAKYYDLAWFLKHTGPDGVGETPKRTASTTSKGTFRFFRKGSKLTKAAPEEHKDLNDVLFFDKGGLLSPEKLHLPDIIEQKVTISGKPYLAVNAPSSLDLVRKTKTEHDVESASVKKDSTDLKTDSALDMPANDSDRHSSQISTLTASHEWLLKYDGREPSPVSPISTHEKPEEPVQEPADALHAIAIPASPIRPAASNPPTPSPESAAVIADAYRGGLSEHPAKYSIDLTNILPKRSKELLRKPVTPLPTLVLRHEEFAVNIPRAGRECDMQHPTPRRLASHPLLHRSSALVAAAHMNSVTESPGTPPPMSPLKLRRESRLIDRTVEPAAETRKNATRTVPTILTPDAFANRRAVVVPTVTTECTGPLTRTRTHPRVPVKHMLYPASRKEREERIRARKHRERAQSISRTIDTMVCEQPSSSRQQTKKTSPLEIDALKPAPLTTKLPADNAWQKTTDVVVTSPVSPTTAHQHSRASSNTTAGTLSSSIATDSPRHDRQASRLLIAEEIPIPKTKSPFRPARIVVAKERVYTPRPRSASMPRSAGKRRSRNSVTMPSRVLTPEMSKESETPPLPSPPPNRALPPTPPASGSEKIVNKGCKIPAPYRTPMRDFVQDWPHPQAVGKERQYVASQAISQAPQPVSELAQLQAELAFVKKKNALLDAALMAVLHTNGESNLPLATLLDRNNTKYAMSWEDRVTRRTEAGHTASSSNGSALDFYLNTRRGSKVGN